LKFLYDHIAKGADFQIRATYKPGTVVVWVSSIQYCEWRCRY
jgi:sulfonate dioxygenase